MLRSKIAETVDTKYRLARDFDSNRSVERRSSLNIVGWVANIFGRSQRRFLKYGNSGGWTRVYREVSDGGKSGSVNFCWSRVSCSRRSRNSSPVESWDRRLLTARRVWAASLLGFGGFMGVGWLDSDRLYEIVLMLNGGGAWLVCILVEKLIKMMT